MSRQDIPPKSNDKYSDIFWANIYGTLCNFGFAEIRLIWTRYSAFLIAHSIFLGLIGRKSSDISPLLLILLAAGGFFLSWLWMAMNSLGWTYQNLWYWHAARLKFTKLEFPLPTDFCSQDDVPRPSSSIFVIAQLVVVLFVLAYAFLLGYSLTTYLKLISSILISLFIIIIILLTAYIAHKKFFNQVRKQHIDIKYE